MNIYSVTKNHFFEMSTFWQTDRPSQQRNLHSKIVSSLEIKIRCSLEYLKQVDQFSYVVDVYWPAKSSQ